MSADLAPGMAVGTPVMYCRRPHVVVCVWPNGALTVRGQYRSVRLQRWSPQRMPVATIREHAATLAELCKRVGLRGLRVRARSVLE